MSAQMEQVESPIQYIGCLPGRFEPERAPVWWNRANIGRLGEISNTDSLIPATAVSPHELSTLLRIYTLGVPGTAACDALHHIVAVVD